MMKASEISNTPMMMNQMPTSTASTVTEVAGTAATTISATRSGAS